MPKSLRALATMAGAFTLFTLAAPVAEATVTGTGSDVTATVSSAAVACANCWS
jgi:hypothetical protein